MDFLKNNELLEKLFDNANEYVKIEKTLLRLPMQNEINKEFITYVKDLRSNNQVRVESKNIINCNKIIARNKNPIVVSIYGEDIYNEYLISKENVIENYGKILHLLSNKFQPFQKITKIKAIKVTKELLNQLGTDKIKINVTWSDSPMIAIEGDYLTNKNYSISQYDFEKQYVIFNKNSTFLS